MTPAKTYFHIMLTLALIAMVGCTKKVNNSETISSNQLTSEQEDAIEKALQVVRGEMAPETVLVDIDGAQLTAGVAKMLIEFRIASIIKQIPPERVDNIKSGMLKNEIEQFVHKNLLLHEAEKQNIEATKEEQDAELAKIAKQLPPDMTLDQAMDNSPWGRDNLIKEMITSIKISKLLIPFQENPVTVTEQDIEEFYKLNKDKLDKPEKIKARHILIKTEKEDSQEVKDEKKKKLEEIRQKIVEGADFAEIAKESSDCASGKMGGDLGEFSRNSPLSQPFKDAAFSQELHKLGPVVESEFGYHIIEVTDHKDATTISRDKLQDIIQNTKRQGIIKAYMDDLKKSADIKYPVSVF